jgi:excisionase family DNA binding protein
MSSADLDKLLTPNEVAELLMVSPTTVRFWAQKDAIKAKTTPGGHRRFKMQDVEEFAASRGMKLQSDRSKLRVLIVDDDIQMARYLDDFLGDFENKFEVEIANYSFEAGLKVRSFNPHVVLLDLMMPGLDGFQVCQMMKADISMKKITVIAMTGYPSDENKQKIKAAGAEYCLPKPIDTEALMKILDAEMAR